MMMRKVLGGAAAAALLLSSTAAVAASPASKLSLASSARAKTATNGKVNKQGGGFPFLIVFVVIAVGLGLYFAVEESDDTPTSP